MHPKLCINCRHCVSTETVEHFGFTCRSHQTKELGLSLVTGAYEPVNCAAARMSVCGPDARHFEAKEAGK